MVLPTEKWAFLIVRQRRVIQSRMGFYKSGVKDKERWYGLVLPYLDIRFIKFLQWGKPQPEKEMGNSPESIEVVCGKCHKTYITGADIDENTEFCCPHCGLAKTPNTG